MILRVIDNGEDFVEEAVVTVHGGGRVLVSLPHGRLTLPSTSFSSLQTHERRQNPLAESEKGMTGSMGG